MSDLLKTIVDKTINDTLLWTYSSYDKSCQTRWSSGDKVIRIEVSLYKSKTSRLLFFKKYKDEYVLEIAYADAKCRDYLKDEQVYERCGKHGDVFIHKTYNSSCDIDQLYKEILLNCDRQKKAVRDKLALDLSETNEK